MISVEGLSKRYARNVAVNNISFEVKKGQITGFLGPNGAGKTTTMRILTCFMPPTEGRVMVAGFDVVKDSMEVRRRIGYLPETPPLYPDMEVEEYLKFVARLKGIESAELPRRVNEAMELCSVHDVREKLIGKLSKGYRQRVGLAQAIIHDPEVLILDEPTSGLDPRQIHETRSLIKSLAGERTVVLSTHILPEVEQVCDNVIIISRGQVVATDTVDNLTNRVRGSEAIAVEVEARGGAQLSAAEVQRKLEQVPGISRVIERENKSGRLLFEVESLQGRTVRGDVARAVVESGWNLNELRPAAMSLEEVFLQLTGSDAPRAVAEEPEGEIQ